MKFLSARHSSGYKNRNWNTTSHYSLFSLDFISRFALWSQHFSLWRGNSFPLCTWKESQKSIWKCFISRSCWELGLAGCDWGMQQLTFFLDSRDLICVTWCYHTFILLFILRAVWTPPLSYPPQLKLHPDLLASALLNHKLEKSWGGSLAATNEHPSYPQYLLNKRMWQLSPVQLVYLIWVVLGELGALLHVHGVLVNQLMQGYFWNRTLCLLQICGVRELQRGVGCLWVWCYDGMIDFYTHQDRIKFQMK